MGDILYRIIRLLGRPFSYRLIGARNMHYHGPAIYVANHLGSIGPIEVILSMPVRFLPWVIAEMADFRRAPDYLYDDFVHSAWRLGGRSGRVVSALVARIAVALINGIGCIPVERSAGLFDESFGRSLALLVEGKSLLIFPEDRDGPLNPETRMRPFLCGFTYLCRMYQERTGRQLPIVPLAVSPEEKTIAIGEPVLWGLQGDRRQDLRKLCHQLQENVWELYQSLRSDTRC